MANQSSAFRGEDVDISSTDHTAGSTVTGLKPTGLYVGTTGNVKADLEGGTTHTFVSMTAGATHAMQVLKVYKTGTTASNMILVEGK